VDKPAHVPYAEVKIGDVLIADGGFTCLVEGQRCLVIDGGSGALAVRCSKGNHDLEGQAHFEDPTIMVGFYKEERR
jgi:hypothetical protein